METLIDAVFDTSGFILTPVNVIYSYVIRPVVS
jgi:hypothetical protein